MTARPSYDLWFDPNGVDADLMVECWISHGPRADDRTFDPQPGDVVTVGDDEEDPSRAIVTRRDGDRVWVQIDTQAEAVGPVARQQASSASG